MNYSTLLDAHYQNLLLAEHENEAASAPRCIECQDCDQCQHLDDEFDDEDEFCEECRKCECQS